MASNTDTFTTGVYHDGEEVAARSRSQHSRKAHLPAVDDDGNVVFVDGDGDRVDEDHDEAEPAKKCDIEANVDTELVLRPVGSVSNRDKCRRCFNREEVADQNKENGGSKSFARAIRNGDVDPAEVTSGNASHSAGD